jgi:hypothetical protein
MSATIEEVEAYKHINIASYAFYVSTLVIWIGLLLRMLTSKDRDKFYGLIVISILMIVSFVAAIVAWQLDYTYNYKSYKGDLNHPDLAEQILQASYFAANTTFNLAHWFFAFSYLALSYRFELIAKKQREDTYNCRLNTVNIVVCLLNVAVTAIVWIYVMKGEGEYKAATIAYGIE